MKKLWAVYAEGETGFLHRGTLTVDWNRMGDLSVLPADKDLYRERFREAYPDEGAVNMAGAVSLLYRLTREVEAGDALVCLHGEWVYLGTVTGGYTYNSGNGEAHSRTVRWLKRLPRNSFSRAALREISSSPQRLFAVKRFANDFLLALENPGAGTPVALPPVFSGDTGLSGGQTAVAASGAASDGADISAVRVPGPVELERETRRFILERLRNALTREEFLEFVPELLRGMGYQVSAVAGSGGTDLNALRDPLLPPVLIRLRHQRVQAEDIAGLERAVPAGEHGVLMTLADFPMELEAVLNAAPSVRGIGGQELAGLTLKAYGNLGERFRRRIPLRQAWLPGIGG